MDEEDIDLAQVEVTVRRFFQERGVDPDEALARISDYISSSQEHFATCGGTCNDCVAHREAAAAWVVKG